MSEIKVNKISPRTACGTTTLGDSGDTFTIPAGVSITNSGTASGFGATGAVSWNTTVKTSGFTAVAGEGYFVNTTGGAISINLPAGTAGAVVGFKDYAGTFDSNAVTLVQNGSDKIGGSTVNAALGTEGQAVTLVFIDSTQGWLVTDSGLQNDASTAAFVAATGGTITTCGNFKIHTFTGPGTFAVSNAGNACGSNTVDYFVVAGGGGGGRDNFPANRMGSGGGGGGFRLSNSTCMPSPLTSPLATPTALPVAATPYPITVGAGGVGGTNVTGVTVCGAVGNPSTFSSITSAGGGGGSGHNTSYGVCVPNPHSNCANGGSGGGIGEDFPNPSGKGTGNTPPVSPPQGNPAGPNFVGAPLYYGTGGGGAGAAGSSATPSNGGAGGIGSFVAQAGFAGCNGTTGPVSGARYFSGGGGSHPSGAGTPTGGGGGGGGNPGTNPGTANTGGAGGGSRNSNAGAGGSGIVIIRYKFQ